MRYLQRCAERTFEFDGLVELLAKASPHRSGDALAGCAADSDLERAAAKWALADVELSRFLDEPVVDYETDDVTRLIIDGHDEAAFAPVRHLTVGGFREWLLETAATHGAAGTLAALAPGLTPEMVAAVSKLMSAADLITVARATRVVTGFRTTVGLPGRMATRLPRSYRALPTRLRPFDSGRARPRHRPRAGRGPPRTRCSSARRRPARTAAR